MTTARRLAPTALALPLAAALATPAPAQTSQGAEIAGTIVRLLVQTGLEFARTGIDLTYEAVGSDPRSGDLTLSGLTLRPALPYDPDRACEVVVNQVLIHSPLALEAGTSVISLSGVSVPAACLPPEPRGMVQGFGFSTVNVQTVGITIGYDARTAAASVLIDAAIDNVAGLSVALELDYLAIKAIDTDEMQFNGASDEEIALALFEGTVLGSAEVTLENRGLFALVEPMIAQQVPDLTAIPVIASAGLGQALLDGQNRALTPKEQALVDSVGAELGRFLQERDSITLSAVPEGGLRLSEEIFEGPAALVEAMDFKLGAASVRREAVVPVDLIQAAISAPDSLSPADRLTVGQALVTGVGAPSAPAAGIALLAPLATDGNGAAAHTLAKAFADTGDSADAYQAALYAIAYGESAAIGLADTLEARLPLAQIVELQNTVSTAVGLEAHDALVAEADVSGMRVVAEGYTTGFGSQRNYTAAMYWATLASAAGDRAAAALVGRLNARLGALDEEREAFSAVREAAAERALATWLEGLGARLAP